MEESVHTIECIVRSLNYKLFSDRKYIAVLLKEQPLKLI